MGRRGVAILAAGCAALAWPAGAGAHPNAGIEVAAGAIGEGVFGGPIAIGGLITAFHNGGLAADGKRVTQGWKTTGYVFGGLNLATAVAWSGFAIGVGNSDARAMGIGLGIAHLAIGALGIGLTAMKPAAREWSPNQAVMTPLVLVDHRGGLAPGAGVLISGF